MEHLIKPYPHQLDILEMSKEHKHLALLWEMGTGKTGATINIIRDKFKTYGEILPTLILTPQVTLFNWQNEFKVWSKIPEDRVIVITGTGKKRIAVLEQAVEGNNIILLNWEALINHTIFDILMDYSPQIVVGDELHYVKSYKSKRSKAAVQITDRCRYLGGYTIGLTGTPILNSPEDIFMQYKFLDGGQTFGENFFRFRNRYMVDRNAGWQANKRFSKWEPNPEFYEELNDKVSSISTRVVKSEVLQDLPPLVKTRRYVEMSPDQMKAYKEMKDDFITFVNENKSAAVANLAVVKALKLMEIVSGFVTDEEGEHHLFKKNPRLEALSDLLEEITPNHKVIVWACWRRNYKDIAKLCDKLNIKHVSILGDMSAEDKADAITAFQTDEKVRVLIGSRGAARLGINLTAASYSIVFSRNFSLEQEKQSEARNHRGGSQIHSKITKIDLVTPQTIDEKVLIALDSKQKISDHIIDLIKEES